MPSWRDERDEGARGSEGGETRSPPPGPPTLGVDAGWRPALGLWAGPDLDGGVEEAEDAGHRGVRGEGEVGAGHLVVAGRQPPGAEIDGHPGRSRWASLGEHPHHLATGEEPVDQADIVGIGRRRPPEEMTAGGVLRLERVEEEGDPPEPVLLRVPVAAEVRPVALSRPGEVGQQPAVGGAADPVPAVEELHQSVPVGPLPHHEDRRERGDLDLEVGLGRRDPHGVPINGGLGRHASSSGRNGCIHRSSESVPYARNAAAVASLSSAPRKNTTLPSAKRHQCCMVMAADLPVAMTRKAQRTGTITSVSFEVNDSGVNSVISMEDAISLKKRATSSLPRWLPYHGADVLAASGAQSTSSATSARTASTSARPTAS